MEKCNKKFLAAVGASLMVSILAIGGTLAYLTDNETTNNTFTVGKVDITLTEPNYPGNEDPSVKQITPNQPIKKDPVITNIGQNDAIGFLVVDIPMDNVTVAGADGSHSGTSTQTELFNFKKNGEIPGPDGNALNNTDWIEISTIPNTKNTITRHVYGYNKKLAKDEKSNTLFDEILLKNVLDKQIDVKVEDIRIIGCAIQSDMLLGPTGTIETADLNKDILTEIWKIFTNQNDLPGFEKSPSQVMSYSEHTILDKEKMRTLLTPEVNNITKYIPNQTQVNFKKQQNPVIQLAAEDPNNQYKIKLMVASEPGPSSDNFEITEVSTFDSKEEIYMWRENNTIYWYSKEPHPELQKDSSYLLSGTNIKNVDWLKDYDLSHVENVSNMFTNCPRLVDISGIRDLENSKLNDVSSMFRLCILLEDISPIANFKISQIDDLSNMFQGCFSLVDLTPLSNWDISNVTDISGMFRSCFSINDLTPLQNWNTSNVKDMHNIFDNCESLTSASALNPKEVSTTSPYTAWDTTNVKNYYNMFSNTNIIEDNLPKFNNSGTWEMSTGSYITNLDLSDKAITILDKQKMKALLDNSIRAIIHYNPEINTNITIPESKTNVAQEHSQEPIYMWKDLDTLFWYSPDPNVYLPKDCSNFFINIDPYNYINMVMRGNQPNMIQDISGLKDFNASLIENMDYMFTGCVMEFAAGGEPQKYVDLSPISAWDTSNVTSMKGTFAGCIIESLDALSKWDTSNVTNLTETFMVNTIKSLKGLENWNTSNVETMDMTFTSCIDIEDVTPLSNWDTSKVINMTEMFSDTLIEDATSLSTKTILNKNGELYEAWNVDNVITLLEEQPGFGKMFYNTHITSGYPKWSRPGTWDSYGTYNAKSPTYEVQTSNNSNSDDIQGSITMLDSSKMRQLLTPEIISIKHYSQNTNPTIIIPDNKTDVSMNGSQYPIYMWVDGADLYWTSKEKNPYLPEDCSNFFYGKSLDLLLSQPDSKLEKSLLKLNNLEGLKDFNASKVKNMEGMFSALGILSEESEIDLTPMADWDISNVKNMSYAFAFSNVITLNGLENWDVQNVIDISYMFANDHYLNDISALEKWNTSNLRNMKGLFSDCSKLADLSGLSKWNTTNVFNIENIFCNCKLLSDLNPISTWNLRSIRFVNNSFKGCSNLKNAFPISAKEIDLSNGHSYISWDLREFDKSQNLIEDLFGATLPEILPVYTRLFNEEETFLDVDKFKLLNARNVDSIKIITEKQNIDPSGKTIVSEYGTIYPIYAYIDNNQLFLMTENKDIKLPKYLYKLFDTFIYLTDISDFYKFDFQYVKNTRYMFSNCWNLKDLSSLANIDFSNITQSDGMFNNCYNIEDITPLSKWDLKNDNNLGEMFMNCVKIKTLDPIQNWVTAEDPYMVNMFKNCKSLVSASNFLNKQKDSKFNWSKRSEMFYGCPLLTKDNYPSWNNGKWDFTKGSFVTTNHDIPTNQDIPDEYKKTNVCLSNYSFDSLNKDITAIKYIEPENNKLNANKKFLIVSDENSPYVAFAYYENNTLYVTSYINTFEFRDDNLYKLFSNLTNLTDISFLSYIDTSNITKISSLFKGCNQLTDLSPIKDWNTSNILEYREIFANCNELIDTSMLSTKLVTSNNKTYEAWKINDHANLENIFLSCPNLDKTNLPKWTTSGSWDMDTMSYLITQTGSSTLEKKKLDPFRSDLIKNFIIVPYDNNKVSSSKIISSNDSEKPVYARFNRINSTFEIFTTAKTIYLPENSSKMFEGFKNLLSLSMFDKFDTSKVKQMSEIFSGCVNLNNIDGIANWNVSNVTTMAYMFNHCEKLNNVNALLEWDTKNLTNINSMFQECIALSNISGLAKLNVSKVTDMWDVFYNCSKLTTLDALANWDVSKVYRFNHLFQYCRNLQDIKGIANWNTSSLTDAQFMFSGCISLKDATPISTKTVTREDGTQYEAWHLDYDKVPRMIQFGLRQVPNEKLPIFNISGHWSSGNFTPDPTTNTTK